MSTKEFVYNQYYKAISTYELSILEPYHEKGIFETFQCGIITKIREKKENTYIV